MKNIIKLFILMIGLGATTACQDQLELKPISAIGDNGFYTNTAEIDAAVVAIYDGLQAAYLREFALTEMRSDNTKTKSSEGEWAQFEDMNVLPTNGAISLYWSGMYNVIFRANKVLENLEVVDNADLKKQFEGEAKFARALAHFNLTRAFGAVPLVTKVVLPSESEAFKKADVAQVLTAIATDLTEAASLLPGRSSIEEGRATVGAAKTLLAKVKLTQGDHAGALPLLEEVMASGEYSLGGDYNEVFYTELNSEVIFTVQYVNDNINESQDFSLEFTQAGLAAGLNYITDDFDAFVDPSDKRMSTLYNPDNEAEVGKFITSSADKRLCGNDWIVLRLADVYLMHVEAIMAGGASTSDADAIASFNMIRDRAGLSTIPAGGTITQQMLLDERRVELAFENHRLYDLVRFGEAESVMSAFAAQEGFTFSPTKLLLPIPQREIDVSFGVLTQNPGY
ncbi:RagB/SusD family nutrient uptake outer membrane protein [Flammeovirgaceae bacterium SG7u.111]|nr:RagB/SusD family nutrient uptake outer membrane protein [Flammeovirgaceae bacterium SG7u.132]WPO33233.1 RagB/SusD family nutrient uptake outer membrane protein [Flammeovirgaceae bacterium SG7u.111]